MDNKNEFTWHLKEGKYISEPIPFWGKSLAIMVKSSVENTITVQKSINKEDWVDIPDFTLAGTTIVFNVINGVVNQSLRTISSTEPNNISALQC